MTVEEIKELINTMSTSKIGELKFENEETKITLKKEKNKIICENQGSVEKEIAQQEVISLENKEEGKAITSPLVGTVYLAPAENEDNFVDEGDQIKKGQIIAIVEAMKLMNDIESDTEGVIKKVLVKNGQTVEYGQPLFLIG